MLDGTTFEKPSQTARMKTILLFAQFLIGTVLFSQDTLIDYHYFQSGEVSTKQIRLTDELRWGYAKAYTRDGKEIYSMQTRRVGGHASVQFRYYESGAVRTAHYTSQPDGGIQRSDIKHHFDEEGNVTSVQDFSTDDQGRFKTITTITGPTAPLEKEFKQESMACAEIYSTEVYAINLSKRKVKIMPDKSVNTDESTEPLVLRSGDTLKIASYIDAQHFSPPKGRISFTINQKKRKPGRDKTKEVWTEYIQESKSKRVYYLLLVD